MSESFASRDWKANHQPNVAAPGERGTGATCPRRWKWTGVLGFLFTIVLCICMYVGDAANSAQQKVASPSDSPQDQAKDGTDATASNPPKKVTTITRTTPAYGIAQITSTTKSEGAMGGMWDCTITVEIDPQGGQVSPMPGPHASWKDATVIEDVELMQVGTSNVWKWQGTLTREPAYAEVIAHFVTTNSELRPVPYGTHSHPMVEGAQAEVIEITSLVPAVVSVGWTGELTIKGNDFGEQGFVTIDGFTAHVNSWKPAKIRVETSAAMTASVGPKLVRVHDKDGHHVDAEWTVVRTN